MELSIVIIARNEESTLGRNLEGVAKEVRDLDAEILLIDSASSDRTVSIAKTYPVRIVHLEPSPLLSPAAGRYVGTIASKGKFVFFMDGDMILIPGWLKRGLEEMHEKSLAGVAGRIFFVSPGEELTQDHPDDFPLGEIKGIGLSAIYRRAALDQCGTFNPYAKGEEEIELGYRLLRGGFTLKRVAVPMAYHVDKPKGAGAIDQKAKYFAGTGQILRRYPGSELARRLIRSTAPVFAQQCIVLGTVVALAVLVIAGWYTPAAYLAALAALAVSGMLILKGPTKVLLYFRSIALISHYMAKGFLEGLPEGEGFEKKIRYTITEPPVASGLSAPKSE
ncbi:MAG TPA: glycosyltransferase family A protein [Bacteroidota bacterium]|nr:glycosyltransferase family A protein [Bacteroidota bacterium]